MTACRDCRYFKAVTSGTTTVENATGGECRRQAPRIAPDGAVYASNDAAPYAYWPVVNIGHWCGAWKSRARHNIPVKQ